MSVGMGLGLGMGMGLLGFRFVLLDMWDEEGS